MGPPPSQIVAAWVKAELTNDGWMPLSEICFAAARKNWSTPSESELLDFVESNLSYVAEHLRNDLAECDVDGVKPLYEIDNEQPPYIRKLAFPASDIVAKMRKVDPGISL